MKYKFILAVMFVLSVGSAAFGQVANGSFEDGNCYGGFTYLGAGSSFIPGWSVGGNSVDLICSWWEASEGDRSVDLNGGDAGYIEQAVPTIAGVTYTVGFDMSGNPDSLSVSPTVPWYSPPLKVMTVTADGGSAQIFSYDVSASGNTRTDMRYVSNTYTFTAVDSSTLLRFQSNIPGAYGAVVDNVSIQAVAGPVCHRNNGKAAFKTLNMTDPASFADHIGHGDEPGPCPAA